MRVLLIMTEKLPVPPVRGGAIQTYLASLVPYLASHHELTILSVTDSSLPYQEVAGGVRYFRIPGGLFEGYVAEVERFLATHSFDLIHIFNRPRMVLPVRRAAPTARLILSLHNEMFDPLKIDPAEAVEAIEQVDQIVTVSDYIGRTITSLYPRAVGKVRTIYSGVDLNRFAPSWSAEARRARESLRAQHKLTGKTVILFVGRLSPKKGADLLVRAMPQIHARFPNAALVLVGSKWYGEDRVSDYVAYIRALASRSPLPVVTTGFVTPDEIPPWFWAGDVFVCASQWEEPLARVHYEAMATGLPIVTTARGGNPEVVHNGQNGVVIQRPEEPDAFVEALRPLLSDSALRQRMGKAGREMAEQRFGWERVAAEILAVWAATGERRRVKRGEPASAASGTAAPGTAEPATAPPERAAGEKPRRRRRKSPVPDPAVAEEGVQPKKSPESVAPPARSGAEGRRATGERRREEVKRSRVSADGASVIGADVINESRRRKKPQA